MQFLKKISFRTMQGRICHFFPPFFYCWGFFPQCCTVLKSREIFPIFQEVKLYFCINFTLIYWEMQFLTVFPSGIFYGQNSLLVHSEFWCQYFRYREMRWEISLFSVSVNNIDIRADFIPSFCPKFLGWLHMSHLAALCFFSFFDGDLQFPLSPLSFCFTGT